MFLEVVIIFEIAIQRGGLGYWVVLKMYTCSKKDYIDTVQYSSHTWVYVLKEAC